MNTFLVGGAVRDKLMGIKPKDLDFAVEAASFEHMQEMLLEQGYKLHVAHPEFYTLRMGIPKDSPWRKYGKDADFVLCRKEGEYLDGRRPSVVEPGTIWDDLARRDFTMNAIALLPNGTLFDPHHGQRDIEVQAVRFVGNPRERIEEDGLRVMRALRFAVTKNFLLASGTEYALREGYAVKSLLRVAKERIMEELNKMFNSSVLNSLYMLNKFPDIRDAVFAENRVKLMATLRSEV